MTPERLAEIRAREQAATLGPWLRDFDNAERPVIYVPLEVKGCVSVLFEADWGKEADADFAAHARTDIPDLLSEVERLVAENAQLHLGLHYLSRYGNQNHPGGSAYGVGYGVAWSEVAQLASQTLSMADAARKGTFTPIGNKLASTPSESCPHDDQPT